MGAFCDHVTMGPEGWEMGAEALTEFQLSQTSEVKKLNLYGLPGLRCLCLLHTPSSSSLISYQGPGGWWGMGCIQSCNESSHHGSEMSLQGHSSKVLSIPIHYVAPDFLEKL